MGSLSVKEISGLEEQQECLFHLLQDLEVLESMIEREELEKGKVRIGAEQEMCITDERFHPTKNSLQILKEIDQKQFTTELALFNMELNLNPIEIKTNCFSILTEQLNQNLAIAYQAAEKVQNNKIILTGILPTIRQKNLNLDFITPLNRYQTLNEILKKIRGNKFKLHIKGIHQLIVTHRSILFEACNTSFQVHLQLEPKKMIEQYNWAQAIAGPVLSVCTNSPLLMGRELWSETRIALFQQSVDLRNASYLLREQKARVAFGTHWIQDSILELFKDDFARYAPILTTEGYENASEIYSKGEIPKLSALNLFNGTLYKWNRLCYGVTENQPHLRIENRYIPAGPTVQDEIANAAFWIGLMLGMPKKYETISDKMEFDDARGNFIRAARTGLETCFDWMGKRMTASDLILNELIPIAIRGLQKQKVDETDIHHFMGIIKDRVKSGITGSKWIIKNHRRLRKHMTRESANYGITAAIYKNQISNWPVHTWPDVNLENIEKFENSHHAVERFMTTELFVVNENSLVELIEKVMAWKNIRHMPVVNLENKLVGLITKTRLMKSEQIEKKTVVAKEIMATKLITIDPTTSVLEAKKMMMDHEIGCLPVLEKGDLVGIITKKDVQNIEYSE